MGTKIRDFSLDPEVAVLTLEMRAYSRHQVADHPNPAFGSLKTEPQLVGKSHRPECTGEVNERRKLDGTAGSAGLICFYLDELKGLGRRNMDVGPARPRFSSEMLENAGT